EADGSRDRTRGVAVTRRFAEGHPSLLGTWVAFEPNEFGADAPSVRRSPLGDANGRFAVWAARLKGPLSVMAWDNPPGQPWTAEDYYRRPVDDGFDGMLEPYLDTGSMMTSYVTPIVRGSHRVGAAGVDIGLKNLDARTKKVKIL